VTVLGVGSCRFMPLESTESSARTKHLASKAELHRLGEIAARVGPGKGTRKFDPADHHIPREAKVTFAVGAGLLAFCLLVLGVRAFTRSPDGGGTTAPAATRGK